MNHRAARKTELQRQQLALPRLRRNLSWATDHQSPQHHAKTDILTGDRRE